MQNPKNTIQKSLAPLTWALLIALIVILGYLYFLDCNSPIGQKNCTQVLFIGNSYTSVNDLPATFTKLAFSGGHKVKAAMSAPGGWTLSQHAADQATLNLIRESTWDYVVLQEQSQIPASAESRSQSMYPAARSLVSIIETSGARPVFFIPWAHQNGWPEAGFADYEGMQIEVLQGYLILAKQEKTAVAPVGYAWLMENRQNPLSGLWNEDGIHPSPKGTYLAACVFYATLFNQSPVGLKYYGGLSSAEAAELQTQAQEAYLASAQWDITP